MHINTLFLAKLSIFLKKTIFFIIYLLKMQKSLKNIWKILVFFISLQRENKI